MAPSKSILVFSITATFCGMLVGFTIITIPRLEGSVNEISWFASMCGFIAPIGSVMAGVVIEKFGRRSALLWGTACSILGWLLIGLSEKNVTQVLMGRVACDLAFGTLVHASREYNLGYEVWTVVITSIVMLFCLAMSLFVTYRELAGVISAISTVKFCLIWFMLKSQDEDTPPQPNVKISAHENNKFSFLALKSDLNTVKRENVFKPVAATAIFSLVLSATGALPRDIATIHTEYMKKEPLYVGIMTYFLTILFSAILCIILLLNFKARKYSIPGIFAMRACIDMFAYATTDSADLYMIRIASIWFVALMFNIGVCYLPGALLGYILPRQCKTLGTVMSAGLTLFSAVLIKLYPYVESYYHGYLYLGYMLTAFIASVFAYYYWPETVDKTNSEIEDGLREEMKIDSLNTILSATN